MEVQENKCVDNYKDRFKTEYVELKLRYKKLHKMLES